MRHEPFPDILDGSDAQIKTPISVCGQGSALKVHPVWNTLFVHIRVNETVFSIAQNAFFAFPPTSPFAAIARASENELQMLEGGTKERPISLSSVSECQFDNFMRVVYPLPRIKQPSTFDDWIGVLTLATMWQHSSVREQAIARLAPMIKDDPAAKLRLGKEHNVQDWVRSGYSCLISNAGVTITEPSTDPCYLDEDSITKVLETRRRSVVGIFLSAKKSML